MTKGKVNPTLYVLDVRQFADEELFLKAYNVSDTARKEKTDRYRFKKDRYLSVGAGLLLKYALMQYGIIEPEICCNKNGKPYLNGENIYFNISHCEDYAICAVSSMEIGCDIELIKKPNIKIAQKFFDKSEFEDIVSSDKPDRQFFRYWTLKESFVKAIGTGISVPLNSFCVKAGKDITLSHKANGKDYIFYEYSFDGNYCISVCTEKGSPAPKLIRKTAEQLLSEII